MSEDGLMGFVERCAYGVCGDVSGVCGVCGGVWVNLQRAQGLWAAC